MSRLCVLQPSFQITEWVPCPFADLHFVGTQEAEGNCQAVPVGTSDLAQIWYLNFLFSYKQVNLQFNLVCVMRTPGSISHQLVKTFQDVQRVPLSPVRCSKRTSMDASSYPQVWALTVTWRSTLPKAWFQVLPPLEQSTSSFWNCQKVAMVQEAHSCGNSKELDRRTLQVF